MNTQPDVQPRARVFILSSQSLFGLGIENLLRQAAVQVVGRESDLDRALQSIQELAPDVIILNSADTSCYPSATVFRLMNETVGTRIIKLNLKDNSVCIYREEQRQVEEVGDLARFVCQLVDENA